MKAFLRYGVMILAIVSLVWMKFAENSFSFPSPPGNGNPPRSPAPLLSPLDKNGWRSLSCASFGDPYFAEAAYYQAQITLPREYKVLASGALKGKKERGKEITWIFHNQHPIREFAFAASSKWLISTRQEGPVTITMGGTDGFQEVLETASQALRFFQKIYSPYPYTYLHVAFVPLEGFSGMQYPGLILLNRLEPQRSGVLIHEIAHQWWYNMVGNNSIQEAWIHEGLAEYSPLLFYKHLYPDVYRAKTDRLARLGESIEVPIDLPLEKYGQESLYRQGVYARRCLFWLLLEKKAGEEKLLQALRFVQEYYRYEIVPSGSLKIILKHRCPPSEELFPLFMSQN